MWYESGWNVNLKRRRNEKTPNGIDFYMLWPSWRCASFVGRNKPTLPWTTGPCFSQNVQYLYPLMFMFTLPNRKRINYSCSFYCFSTKKREKCFENDCPIMPTDTTYCTSPKELSSQETSAGPWPGVCFWPGLLSTPPWRRESSHPERCVVSALLLTCRSPLWPQGADVDGTSFISGAVLPSRGRERLL